MCIFLLKGWFIIKLSEFRQFIAVAKTQNVSKAADQIYLSQPALSRSINRLEKKLGVPLFDRNKQHLTLNNAGEIALKQIERILKEVDNLEMLMKSYVEEERPLQFYSSMGSCLRYFIINYTNSCIEPLKINSHYVLEKELPELLLNGKADITISSKPIKNDDTENLFYGEIHQFVSLPLNSQFEHLKSISIHELDGLTFIIRSGINSVKDKLFEILKQENVNIHLIFEDDYLIFNELLRNSNYYAFASNLTLDDHQSVSNRKIIPIEDHSVKIPIYISYKKDNSQFLSSFINWFKKSTPHFKPDPVSRTPKKAALEMK